MGTAGLRCEKLLSVLGDYLDGSLKASLCRDFERHLKGCDPCQVVIDTTRKTITLYKAGKPYALPPAFRSKLHRALRSRWKARAKTSL